MAATGFDSSRRFNLGSFQTPLPSFTHLDLESPNERLAVQAIARKVLTNPADLDFFSAQITFSGRYKIVKILGEGSFGVVVLVHEKSSKKNLVFKISKKRNNNNDLETEYKNLRRLTQIDPEHTVLTYSCHKLFMNKYKKWNLNGTVEERLESPRVIIISEYGGLEVYNNIVRNNSRPWQFTDFMHLFCQGLAYWKNLQSNGLVHKDIKPQNMLTLGPFQTPGCLKFIDPSSLGEAGTKSEDWYENSRFHRSPTTLWGEFSSHEIPFALATSFYSILTGKELFPSYASPLDSREFHMKQHLKLVFGTLGFPEASYFEKLHPRLRNQFFKLTETSEGPKYVFKDAEVSFGRKKSQEECIREMKDTIIHALRLRFKVERGENLRALSDEIMDVLMKLLKNHFVTPDDLLGHGLFERYPDIFKLHCSNFTSDSGSHGFPDPSEGEAASSAS